MSNLKPCPFCGSSNVDAQGCENFAVICKDCGANGPVVSHVVLSVEIACQAAERQWNERPGDDDARLSIPDVMAINEDRTKIYISHGGKTIEYTADQLPDGAAAYFGIKKGNEDEN